MPAPKTKKPRRRGDTEKEKDKISVTQCLLEAGLSPTQTLLDLRGSVPVPGPQDLDAIRKQVIVEHITCRGEPVCSPTTQNDDSSKKK